MNYGAKSTTKLLRWIRWRMWRFRIVWWAWEMWVVARYVITGECGCACDWVVIRDLQTGQRALAFVPEAECPIHDVGQVIGDTYRGGVAVNKTGAFILALVFFVGAGYGCYLLVLLNT